MARGEGQAGGEAGGAFVGASLRGRPIRRHSLYMNEMTRGSFVAICFLRNERGAHGVTPYNANLNRMTGRNLISAVFISVHLSVILVLLYVFFPVLSLIFVVVL